MPDALVLDLARGLDQGVEVERAGLVQHLDRQAHVVVSMSGRRDARLLAVFGLVAVDPRLLERGHDARRVHGDDEIGGIPRQLVPLAEPSQAVADDQRLDPLAAELLDEVGGADATGRGYAHDRDAQRLVFGDERREFRLVERRHVVGQWIEAGLLERVHERLAPAAAVVGVLDEHRGGLGGRRPQAVIHEVPQGLAVEAGENRRRGPALEPALVFLGVLVDLLGDVLGLAQVADVDDLERRLGVHHRHGDRGVPAGHHDLHAPAVDGVGDGLHRLLGARLAVDPDDLDVTLGSVDRDRHLAGGAGVLERHHGAVPDGVAGAAGRTRERSHDADLDRLARLARLLRAQRRGHDDHQGADRA